jgi:hypothetical protein
LSHSGRGALRGSEGGSISVTALFGVAIFLGFLLLASQVLVHLTATSVVTTAAFDAARRSAADGGGGCATASERARAVLGSYGRRGDVAVTCLANGQSLRVTVSGPSPARGLARGFVHLAGAEHIRRSATVRIERGP